MGRAGGHMRHPFDLDIVTDGMSFLNLWNNIKIYLEGLGQQSNLKIDGINTSFKFVNNQFAVDFASQSPLDIEGVTIDKVHLRYPNPKHGLAIATPKLLTIFNEAYQSGAITQEITALGLIDNPHFYVNAEFFDTATATNVADYQVKSFIALHGIRGFRDVFKPIAKSKGGGQIQIRKGLPRPIDPMTQKPEKQDTVEVPYDMNAMKSLIQKVRPFAQKHGFELYGPINTFVKPDTNIVYSGLQTPITVNVSDDYSDQYGDYSHLNGRSLKEWIEEIDEKPARYNGKTYEPMYTNSAGTKINPYHKATYLAIIKSGVNADELIAYEDVKSVVNGAIMFEATRLLGNDILNAMSSQEMGDLTAKTAKHEGIVIRDPRFFKPGEIVHPFKITGEFIVSGQDGAISQKIKADKDSASLPDITVTESYLRHLIRESIRRILI